MLVTGATPPQESATCRPFRWPYPLLRHHHHHHHQKDPTHTCSARRRSSINSGPIWNFCTAFFSGSGGMITPLRRQQHAPSFVLPSRGAWRAGGEQGEASAKGVRWTACQHAHPSVSPCARPSAPARRLPHQPGCYSSDVYLLPTARAAAYPCGAAAVIEREPPSSHALLVAHSLVLLGQHVLQVCKVPEAPDDLTGWPVVLRQVCARAHLRAGQPQRVLIFNNMLPSCPCVHMAVPVPAASTQWAPAGCMPSGARQAGMCLQPPMLLRRLAVLH